MSLLSSHSLCKSFGSKTLFESISFGVSARDKIALIGPNGAGKSTLMKILAGIEKPDHGSVVMQRGLKVGYVPQDNLFEDVPILHIVTKATETDSFLSDEERITKSSIALGKVGFSDFSQMASTLSGGWKKRLAIACAIVLSPDILFLDEPTNHLDLEGVLWLEKFLKGALFAFIVISHDRCFLENLVNRVVELDKSYPKGIFATDGSYSDFLVKREEFLTGQKNQQLSLASKVRREMEWLKQNPKARTTKSTARISEANRLISSLKEITERNQQQRAQIAFSASPLESKKLIACVNCEKSLGNKLLFSKLDLTLFPGIRLGIVGENGSGKTTLLKMLAGEIQPDKGTIKYADGVKIVIFDQNRTHFPNDITLRRALAPENDTVNYRGQNIHVNGWCKKFLFTPDKLDLPFGFLSGGEKARVHIARFMLQPADVLLLDEPTNDLDIPTLEVLESCLQDFPGAVVLISHDRYFLDSIANVILGLTNNEESLFFADYLQWEAYKTAQEELKNVKNSKSLTPNPPKEIRPTKKMSYMEKREWEQMEKKIESLEEEITKLSADIEAASVLGRCDELEKNCLLLSQKNKSLEHLFERWQYLETLL